MQKLFIIGYVWPEPTASAAGIRMLQLIRFFREQGYEVHFGTPAQKPDTAFDLGKLGVTTHEIAVNDSDFDSLISGIDPQIVLFDRFMMEEQFSWRVAEHVPKALRMLDTEDLHFLRKFRQKATGDPINPDPAALRRDAIAKREIASIYRCDLTLIISEREMEILQSIFGVPAHILVYHPLFAEDRSVHLRDKLPGFQHREDMVFIGNFFHEPNADAVRCLEEGVWEEIHKRLPGVRLHIYGAYMPESLKSSSVLLKRNVVFHGRAEDVDAVMQKARVCLVPLRFGAGLKGKLIRAMENGLPSVTTPVGAEGISDNTNFGGAVVPLGKDFTESAITLYTDEKAWIKAVEQGFRIIDHKFRREAFEQTFASRINACMLDLSFHRSGNFTGQMLMDQRNMAARYLSKYIMAKNANSR